MIPAGIAVVVCGLLIALVAASGGDGSPSATPASSTTSSSTTSTTVAESTTTTTEPPDPVTVDELLATTFAEDRPAAYRITYDIVESELPRNEVWVVRRPYESYVESTRDGEITTATATSRTALWTYLTDRQGWLKLQPELHRAAFDVRPAAALGPMVALGLAEPLGPDEIDGRACQRFLTGSPTGASFPKPPSDDESTELCIDDNGLLLHELWRLNGNVVTERTATVVELDPAIDPSIFDPEPEVEDAEQYEALLGQIAVPADEETLARLQTDVTFPAGYDIDGTVLRTAAPGQSGAGSAAEVIRFASNGVDLVEYAEVFSDGEIELGGGAAVPVEGPGIERETWFVPGLRDSAVRIRVSASSYAELRGTDPALLFELAATLTVRDSG